MPTLAFTLGEYSLKVLFYEGLGWIQRKREAAAILDSSRIFKIVASYAGHMSITEANCGISFAMHLVPTHVAFSGFTISHSFSMVDDVPFEIKFIF